jgi:hypothetical protein
MSIPEQPSAINDIPYIEAFGLQNLVDRAFPISIEDAKKAFGFNQYPGDIREAVASEATH